MKKILIYGIGIMLGLSLGSCSSESSEQAAIDMSGFQFKGIVLPSEYDDTPTRAYIQNDYDCNLAWQIGDVVGVFATSGPQQSQVEYVINQVEGTKCKFTPGSYFNCPGYEFTSYFPLQEKYLRYNSDISLSLAGQCQKSNNSTEGLTDYLFYVTPPTAPKDETTFYFEYSRYWSLICTDFTMPKAGTWKKLIVKAPTDCSFHENIKYNFAKDGGAGITESDNVGSITLTLGENGEGITTASGENLKLFMFICPTEMTGKDIDVEVVDDNGIVYSCTISGKKASGGDKSFFKSNMIYDFIGSPVKSGNIDDITGTGCNFNTKRTE